MELQLKDVTLKVPKNTGVDGFMHTLREILKLSRVQSILMDDKGTVTYKRYIVEGEDPIVGIDFEGLSPWPFIRNNDIEELRSSSRNAATIILVMMDAAVSENLHPTVFVVGHTSVLWTWYLQTTGTALRSKSLLCGLPVYSDKNVPDTALMLCAAYESGAALIDTRKTFKIEMDMFNSTPTEVDVL